VFRQSFIYRSNFTENRNKLLRNHQVLHCVFNGLLEVDHPGFAAAIQSISTTRITLEYTSDV
jgi:hypothetical protein